MNRTDSKRPLSITIIAWLMLLFSARAAILVLIAIYVPDVNAMLVKDFHNNGPMSEWFQYATMVLGTSSGVIAAIAILRGKNWARLLYVLSTLVVSLILLSLAGFDKKRLIIPSVTYAATTVFLFRPKANDYFRQAIL